MQLTKNNMPNKIRAEVRALRAPKRMFIFPLAACLLWASPLTALAQASAAGTPAGPAAITVNAVRVEGNTLLSQNVLDAHTASLRGSGKTLADINAAAARLQAAYRDAGFGGVVAFVPEQDASSGTVVIRVVEGKLANVRVKGHQLSLIHI